MVYACIDIGSNTTRLLVAEPVDGRLRELASQRAFTRIGKGMKREERISGKKIEEVSEVVAMQVRVAQELGTGELRAVATAAIREAANQDELLAAVERRAGVQVEVLSDEEEGRLAFVGATRSLDRPPQGEIAVVDVGGASSEIVLGRLDGGMRACTSFRIGSGFIAEAYLHSDPPTPVELGHVRTHVAGVFEGFELPRPALAIAVGGSATSLRRMLGAVLDHETLERGLRILAGTPSEQIARAFELEQERVRMLPAGMLILEEISDRLGCRLQIGRGGLREGVILEMLR
ncbi:MAG: Ppx/GppA phosphatase family protein [Solirubrobacteraceae bacterium]